MEQGLEDEPQVLSRVDYVWVGESHLASSLWSIPSLTSHNNQNASPLPATGMLTLDVAWQDRVVHSAPASTFIYLFLEAVNSSAFLPSLSFLSFVFGNNVL